MTTLEDNECVPRRGGGKSKSLLLELVEAQKNLKEELESITVIIALKDAEIIALKVASVKEGEKGINSGGKLKEENVSLRERVEKLEAQVEALSEKNEALKEQILKAYAAEYERMNILLRQLDRAIGTSF